MSNGKMAREELQSELEALRARVGELEKAETKHKRTEEALRESERRSRAIFDQTFQFIGLMTPDGTLVEANRTALKFAGIEESAVLGKPFWETPWWSHSPELQDRLRDAVDEAAAGEFVRFEATHPAADGSLHYVDFSLKPVKDEAGNVSLLIPEGRDITERKRAERALRFTQFAIDRSTDAAFWLDPDARLIYCNNATTHLLGYSREQLLSMTLHDFALEFPIEAWADHWQALKERGSMTFETLGRTKDGRVLPVEVAANFLEFEGQEYDIAFVRDITERKRAEEQLRKHRDHFEELVVERTADLRRTNEKLEQEITEHRQTEEALRESERRSRAIFDQTFEFIGLLAPDGTLLEANSTSLRFGEVEESDVLGKPFWETPWWTHSVELQNELREAINKAAAGEFARFEAWHSVSDGSIRYVDTSVKPVKDEVGNVVFLIPEGRDITERKQGEKELRESEAKFRALAEMAPTAIFIFQGTKVRFANPASERMTGYTQEELLTIDFWEFAHPDHIEEVKARGMARQRGEEVPSSYETRVITKNGETRWVEVAAGRIDFAGEPAGIVILHDITERKKVAASLQEARDSLEIRVKERTEELFEANATLRTEIDERERVQQSLEESEEKYRALFEQAADSVVVIDAATGSIVEFNDRAHENLGYSREEFTDLTIPDVEAIETADEVVTHTEKIVEKGSDSFETIHRTKDGEARNILVTSRQIAFRGKSVIQSLWRDITTSKQAETALRESERKYRMLAENITDVIWSLDLNGRFTYVSPSVERLRGYTAEEVLQQTVEDVVTPSSLEMIRKLYKQRLEEEASGKRDNTPSRYELEQPCKDGSMISTEVIVSPLRDEDGLWVGLMGVTRDITARKRAEELARQRQAELAHVSRLSTMGEMASGLAHELGQPLVAISSYSQGCLRRMQSGTDRREELLEVLSEITAQARRAGDIIHHLKDFTRKDEAQWAKTNINELVREAAGLAEIEARQFGAAVRLELTDRIPDVYADAVQVEQVVLNLMRNGIEAMNDPECEFRELVVRTSTTDDHRLAVEVQDTGPGIPEEIKDQIFDPFVTTKPDGMGIGLSISRTIIETHGGRLSVGSDVGGGTTFKFALPVREDPKDE